MTSTCALLPDLGPLLEIGPYSLPATEKASQLTLGLRQLTEYHRHNCADYARMLSLLGKTSDETLADIPFLPVRTFKEFELLSVPKDQVFKTMTSSGTSGQQVSKIYLDRTTAALQGKVLARLMTSLLGKQRRPMLIIDAPNILRDRQAFSARGAGILGFSMFGYDVTYALDEQMQLNLPRIEAFLAKHQGTPLFIFGFTFMVWQHFYQPLIAANHRLALGESVLLHGGGWKKLQDEAVSARAFRKALAEQAGIQQVVNYYGMVEQTGTLYMECPNGHLHAPIFSDILVRDPSDFSVMPHGQSGLIEVLSLLAHSYPGHALLTEDLGTILGEDNCPCGRLGKYFSIEGRIPRAEARGCSDTYAQAA